jgi:hypothetical protein
MTMDSKKFTEIPEKVCIIIVVALLGYFEFDITPKGKNNIC